MKTIIRKRFVPTHYYMDICNKLQIISHGSRSVDQYFKNMEIAMIKVNIFKDIEATWLGF